MNYVALLVPCCMSQRQQNAQPTSWQACQTSLLSIEAVHEMRIAIFLNVPRLTNEREADLGPRKGAFQP